MRKSAFVIRKWAVRAFVVVGALIGISSCSNNQKKNICSDESSASTSESSSSSSSSSSTSSTSMSSSDVSRDIEVIEDVYGPPVGENEDMSAYETVYGPPVEDMEPVEPDIVDEPLPSDEYNSSK